MKRHLDIIIPCYNEQENICSIFRACSDIMREIADWDFCVMYVNDGSKDETLFEIKQLALSHNNVRYISFSRNFGKEAAMYAGLQSSRGDAVVLMDADHQHPPAMIPEMLAGLDDEFDCVAVHRTNRRGEPLIRSWFAGRFYRLMNTLSDVSMEPGARDFRAMSSQMRDAILTMSERERFSKGLFAWVGFKTKWIELPNIPRAAGTTKWSFSGLLKYAVGGIVAFSTVPLRLASGLGFIVILASFLYAVNIIYGWLRYGTTGTGFATVLVLLLFLCGLIIMLLGIIGEYLARIYMEVKRRPIYITQETNIIGETEQHER